jgi:hypothetical protein
MAAGCRENFERSLRVETTKRCCAARRLLINGVREVQDIHHFTESSIALASEVIELCPKVCTSHPCLPLAGETLFSRIAVASSWSRWN